MYADIMLKEWLEDHQLRAPSMKNSPAFYRNLEQVLDISRQEHRLITFKPPFDESVADFSGCDTLSLSRSGKVREAFFEETARYPKFNLGAGGSRAMNGNYQYLGQVEKEIADFHGAESAFITPTGSTANHAAIASVMQPGDAFVYDELVHASTIDAMHLSLARHKLPFRHNDPDSLREILFGLKDADQAFVAGTRSILISVESIYSMEGDVCPLEEMVQIVKEEFPLGNAQFHIDEAHTLGIIGENGRGLVSMLGLEKDIAIRVHVAGKALGSAGGIVLCNQTIRFMMLNHSRAVTYSCAPSFLHVASIRAGYKLLMSGETKEAQENIQKTVRYFFEKMSSDSIWERAVDERLLWIPMMEDWESRPFQSHIVSLRTRARHEQFVFYQLLMNNINAYPITFPVVPKGETRMRIVFHAHNTLEQAAKLAKVICDYAREVFELEEDDSRNLVPSATRQVYAMQSTMEVA